MNGQLAALLKQEIKNKKLKKVSRFFALTATIMTSLKIRWNNEVALEYLAG